MLQRLCKTVRIVLGCGVESASGSNELRQRLEANPWRAIVGPCYTCEAMKRELGERVSLSEAVADLQALRLTTSDGADVFPVWQVANGALVPGLQLVLQELRAGIDSPWTWAKWFVGTPLDVERSRVELLLAGCVDELVVDARHTAAAWLN